MLNHHGKVDRSIGPGDHFGVMEMLFGLPKVSKIILVFYHKKKHFFVPEYEGSLLLASDDIGGRTESSPPMANNAFTF